MVSASLHSGKFCPYLGWGPIFTHLAVTLPPPYNCCDVVVER